MKKRHQVAVHVGRRQVPAQRDGGSGNQHVTESVRDNLLVAGRSRGKENQHLILMGVGVEPCEILCRRVLLFFLEETVRRWKDAGGERCQLQSYLGQAP